ncbi:cystatin-A [Spea bombifrons]|uniref:cystatin-A n=1 Tax=Spea bombifrons TaxID=233779 RepID=UPI002349B557|nr:cystatin-A [Spea bombifrons]
MPMVGGLGAAKPATPEIQELCDSVKVQAEAKCGANFSTFEAVEYKTQVVAGTNYFVKVFIGGDKYAHVRIYQALPHAQQGPTVHSCQLDKSREEEIVHF